MKTIYKNIHQDLIDRCRQNDKQAQFSLYKLYYKAMFNTAFRILNVEQEAEDVMQEAFLKAFSKISDYREEVTFGVWLKRIVINRSLDELKKRKMMFDDLDSNLEAEADYNNDDAFDYSIEDIKKAMNKLSEGYRTVISLFLFEGYDHEEISQILGISNATSRTQYLRAKRKLREILIAQNKAVALN